MPARKRGMTDNSAGAWHAWDTEPSTSPSIPNQPTACAARNFWWTVGVPEPETFGTHPITKTSGTRVRILFVYSFLPVRSFIFTFFLFSFASSLYVPAKL